MDKEENDVNRRNGHRGNEKKGNTECQINREGDRDSANKSE